MGDYGASAPIRASDALLKKLAKIGLHREADLLVHLPLRYEDETRITPVAHRALGRSGTRRGGGQQLRGAVPAAPADGRACCGR